MKHMNRMKWLGAAVVVVAAVLVVAAPATANNVPEAGSRINVGAPPTTFPANTPFHVSHGVGCAFSEEGCPEALASGSLFSLYVDGVLQLSKVVVFADHGGITKVWLTNFWDGLPAGDHTLVGVWTQNGVVVQTATATITFT